MCLDVTLVSSSASQLIRLMAACAHVVTEWGMTAGGVKATLQANALDNLDCPQSVNWRLSWCVKTCEINNGYFIGPLGKFKSCSRAVRLSVSCETSYSVPQTRWSIACGIWTQASRGDYPTILTDGKRRGFGESVIVREKSGSSWQEL